MMINYLMLLAAVVIAVYVTIRFFAIKKESYYVLYFQYEKDEEAEDGEDDFIDSKMMVYHMYDLTKDEARKYRDELMKDNTKDEGTIAILVRKDK